MVRRSKSSISANRKVVSVCFLDGTSVKIETEVDLLLRDVFDKACYHKGITETALLGLASLTTPGGQAIFLDLNTKIAKNAPKAWKSSHQGVDDAGEPVYTVQLLVQVYVDKLSTIRDPQAKNYYYKQLRKNFLDYPIMYPDDRCFLIAAYSLIAEGYDNHSDFDPRLFFPAWVVDKHSSKYIREHLPALLNDFTSLTALEAQNLVSVSLCHETPISYNMHMYQMSRDTQSQHCKTVIMGASSTTKTLASRTATLSETASSKQSSGSTNSSKNQCLRCAALYLGIGARGIETFEVGTGGFIQTLARYSWNQVTNLNYSKRRLELKMGSGITLRALNANEQLCQNVYRLCQQTNENFIKRQQEKLQRSITKSFRAPKPGGGDYRESLIDTADECTSPTSPTTHTTFMAAGFPAQIFQTHGFHAQGFQAQGFPARIKSGDYYKQNRQNRYSIISDAASSTTSGIVSDRTCFSYYDSQEELLSGSKIITSSQDSLLQPSQALKNIRLVQRATSEPSKKFESLRELNVRQHRITPAATVTMYRAASDDTVRSTNLKLSNDHTYENISEVRNRLLIAAQTKPSKLSPRVSLNTSLPGLSTRLSYSRHRPTAQSQGSLNNSMGSLSQLALAHNTPGFRSQYSMLTPSTSMEQLLKDYQPPPSYNDNHKKLRAKMLAGMSSNDRSHVLTTPQNSKLQKYRSATFSSEEPKRTVATCTCRTTSYPEIDKLKDMTGFPMIQALCNDKDLQQLNTGLSGSCAHCHSSNSNNNNNSNSMANHVSNVRATTGTPISIGAFQRRPPNQVSAFKPVSNRPFSWHSESYMLSSSLPNETSTRQKY